jgi:hypothetical protein
VVTTTSPAVTAPERAQRPGAVRAAFTGSWPMFAAWGAGLVLAAMGAGGVVGPDGSLASRGVGILVFTLGIAALAWGTAAMVRGRVILPRTALGGAVAAVVLATALLIAAPAHTSVLSLASATALSMIVCVYAAAALRRRGAPRPARAMSVWGMLLAAALLSAIVTPSLGSTQDAVLIRDDGSIPVITHH